MDMEWHGKTNERKQAQTGKQASKQTVKERESERNNFHLLHEEREERKMFLRNDFLVSQ